MVGGGGKEVERRWKGREKEKEGEWKVEKRSTTNLLERGILQSRYYWYVASCLLPSYCLAAARSRRCA
jgi:hypothetical protein